MTKQSPPESSRGARWILILSALGVATALFVVWVVGREKPRRSDNETSSASGADARRENVRRSGGAESRRGSTPSRRKSWSGRGDRRRLAKLLGRRPPGEAPASGEAGGHGGEAAYGGESVDETPDPVFPVNAQGIRGAIRERISEVKECYEGWQAFDDTLAGKLVVAFTIEPDPDGDLARISRAELQSSSLHHPGLERCVLVMMESLRFEAPENGSVTVRYPFRFRTGKSETADSGGRLRRRGSGSAPSW